MYLHHRMHEETLVDVAEGYTLLIMERSAYLEVIKH